MSNTVGAQDVTVSPFSESGSTGLIYSNSGYVEEEFLPTLLGRQAIRVWKEMRDNDPVIGAELFCIDMLLRSVEWSVQENPDAENPEDDAQFLEECKDDMSSSWVDFISEVMTMLPFGWSWFEQVYKQRNGPQDENDPNAPASSKYNDKRIGWRKFVIRAQESLEKWDFDQNGGVKGMYQRPAPTFDLRYIPIQKSLLFRTVNHKGNPEGRSIFRNAYRPWFFKERIERIEGTGIERDLAGMPVAYVDPEIMKDTASDDEKKLLATITRIVTQIKRDKNEGVVWPMAYDGNGNLLYKLELMSSGGSRQFDTNTIITRYNQLIAMTTLADFIMLGHENVGSFALSSDKTDLFATAMGAILDSIQGVINSYAVPRLWTLNGMDPSTCPTIIHGDLDTPDLQELAAYVLSLVQAGMPLFPDKQLENHLRKIAHLPELSEEGEDIEAEDIIDPDDPANPVASPPTPAGTGDTGNQPPPSPGTPSTSVAGSQQQAS